MFETIGQITVAAGVVAGGIYAYKHGWLDRPIYWAINTFKGWTTPKEPPK